MKLQLIGLLGLISITLGQRTPPFWDGLRTTFAIDGLGYAIPIVKEVTKGYAPVPRSVPVPKGKDRWEIVSEDCTNGGAFNGFRYVQRMNDSFRDYTVSALYDVNGIIAGIQLSVLVSEILSDPRNLYQYHKVSMYHKNSQIDGKEVYTLTAYFVDPAIICTIGRTLSALETEGTGNQLSFQNGPSPFTLINIPMKREKALEQGWDNNCCFPGMGLHNFYQQTHYQEDMCSTVRPAFLLYNNAGNLLGFGFGHSGKSSSPRVEKPPPAAISAIVGPEVSQCLLDANQPGGIGFTTMHVYMIDRPLNLVCNPFRSNRKVGCLF